MNLDQELIFPSSWNTLVLYSHGSMKPGFLEACSLPQIKALHPINFFGGYKGYATKSIEYGHIQVKSLVLRSAQTWSRSKKGFKFFLQNLL